MQKVKWDSGIAIVDDERVIIEFYRKVFEMMGIPVAFIAYDGEDAVKKFQECSPRPQVMLMDYRMPIMDGLEAAKMIRSIEPDMKIIFVTADSGAREEAMKVGAAAFLEKPVGLKDIVTQVEKVVKKDLAVTH
ncbi:response regulator [Methanocella sp. MCL-LM]|uniref:response regulator n=1 Tax=Methanocella sp. MCL-LM TaxID=3412035 RepID=UPI003C7093A8